MQFRKLSFILFCVFILPFGKNTCAQNNNTKPSIHNSIFTTDIASWQSKNKTENHNNPFLVLLQFDKILSESEHSKLDASKIILKEYIGSNIYSAWLSEESNFKNIAFSINVASFLPEYKIAPSIYKKIKSQPNTTAIVSFYEGISLQQISQITAELSASIIPQNWQKKGLYKISIASKNIPLLASFFGTKYIGEAPQNIPLDLDSKGAQAAILPALPTAKGGKNLTGKDVFIGHGDNCSGIYHIDQSDRTINYNNGDITSHGVLVNGLIAGDGIIDPAAQGIATNGTCISLYFDAVLLLKEELYKGFNTTLTNNSYAAIVGDCAYSGTYDELSINLDNMAFELPEQLDVFAAGNDGRLVCGGYPAGFYNICGGFQTAKNIINVGATSRDLVIGEGSSRGPLKDGRLKPDIVANGIDVLCPVPPNAYTITRGTSLSCPQVTGVLAMITERYKQLFSGANPRADLLKAITLNAANDLGNPGPDYKYGFGFLNATRALSILENNRFMRNTISSGAAPQTFSISVPSNTAQLKVMLYYHDPAASAASTTQLVNDLDLIVIEPSSLVHRPLVLNPSIATVDNLATEGVDRLNNAEQVTINTPSAGTYTISVADFAIPKGPQEYVVVYDFVPDSLKLSFPVANASASANTDMYIYWDAPYDAGNPTLVEYSINGGASWTTLATVAANTKFYKWAVPTINSNQCKVKISRAGIFEESGNFSINQQPTMALAAIQCPGSIATEWTNVLSASKYYLLLKKGAHLAKVDSVGAGVLSYTYTGLHQNEEYFVAVQPAIGAMDGYRSKAIMAKPNTGTCAAAVNGDLAISTILAPNSGRRFTSSELKNNEKIQVNVRNQDDDAVSNFSLIYKINAGAWKDVSGFSITANSIKTIDLDSFDFSDTISYTIQIAVKNNDRPDPISANDSIVKLIKHLPNDSIKLLSPILNDFESLVDITLAHDTLGLTTDGYWDYKNTNDTGRLRSRIPGSKLVKSARSISMDVSRNCKSNANFLIGTFNLGKYDTSIDEVRFDFEYEMRGMPVLRDSNKVWVRGADTENWIQVLTYSNAIDTSKLHQSGTISLRDFLRKNNQNFSASTQIRFGQYDTTLIVEDNYGGGLTLDNINLYKVSKDLQLISIVSPEKSECNIRSSALTIEIKNGTVNTVNNISMGYSIDGAAPEFESITDSLLGTESLTFTFGKILTGLSIGEHHLKVWVHTDGDDYMLNDTISNYYFYNAAEINVYPYLQNFEKDNGNWYSTGRNSSWAYGEPSGNKINNAASGTKVWKTSLSGNYNNNEQSYLISPCLNTIAMASPMLSFSLIFDIESCVVECDRVVVEYSTDNEDSWQRLGNFAEGTNWYNNEVHNVWNGESARWHVASFELPRASTLKLRFAMKSDLGTNKEGVAIDDIHIFDLQHKIANTSDENKAESAIQSISGISYFSFLTSEDIIGSINPNSTINRNVKFTAFAQNEIIDPVAKQYIMPRSFVVNSTQSDSTGALLRLFLKDNEVQKVWADTSCPSCSKASDIYHTGITQFKAKNEDQNDNSLANNTLSERKFYPYHYINWVPYDEGYYAEFEAEAVGEFWLNDGGLSQGIPANTAYVFLTANKKTAEQAALSWVCAIDTSIKNFVVQYSLDSIEFTDISNVDSKKDFNYNYHFLHIPNVALGKKIFYRLFCIAENGKTFHSNIASVLWTQGDDLISIYPNPFSDGNLYFKWTAAVGSKAVLRLSDALGKTIWMQEITSMQWTNTTTLPLQFLAKGVYFLNINIGEKKYLQKLICK